ncbi:hypothetical protein QVD17_19452 [Tagetes erecta]|uniref:Uncharacterized protein n=1 Tax=Tagetes erecta TaxID=13708 RepID=A0AAD8KQZ9_TARER|nr:hypothetical protein QVD17_19452 [Tagetes erecta]
MYARSSYIDNFILSLGSYYQINLEDKDVIVNLEDEDVTINLEDGDVCMNDPFLNILCFDKDDDEVERKSIEDYLKLKKVLYDFESGLKDHYAKLSDYKAEILETNPRSTGDTVVVGGRDGGASAIVTTAATAATPDG